MNEWIDVYELYSLGTILFYSFAHKQREEYVYMYKKLRKVVVVQHTI